MNVIVSFLLECVKLLVEMAPYLVFGFALAGLLHAFVSKQTVAKQLGQNNFSAVIKAALVGVPLPLCSCGVVPTGIGLMKRGAGKAATVSFLISTPQTGVDSMFVTYGFFGWLFAIFRPVAAFISGIIGGLAVMVFGNTKNDKSHWEQFHQSHEDALEEKMQSRSLGEKLLTGAKFAFGELLGDIALWLVIGIAIAALITMLVPDDFFVNHLNNRFEQMMVMMAFGIPLYVCSTASIPIAAVLMMKGISPGAAFVFLMTGPATNAATIAIIGKVLGMRVLSLYLGSIAVLALLFGYALDWLVSVTGWQMAEMNVHDHEINQVVGLLCAGLLSFFITNHFYNSLTRKFSKMNTTDSGIDLTIEGMNCSHCVSAVEGSLKQVQGVMQVKVTLENGQAHIEGENLDRTILKKAVENVGYEVGE